MFDVVFQDVVKYYGIVIVVENMMLCIVDGELVVFFGFLGCGKIIILCMIGGFVDVIKGWIMVGGCDVIGLLLNWCNMGFVFQNYVLFLYMIVVQNVVFGLEMCKVNKFDVVCCVCEVLVWVCLF